MKFAGKVALVTGASRNLGAGIAKALADEGAVVAVNYAHNEAKAAAVVEAIEATGGKAFAVRCDIADEDDIATALATIELRCGGVDILVNNARCDPYLRPDGLSEGDWFDRQIGVNLKGAYLLARVVMPGMQRNGWGRIINVSSIWAHDPAAPPLAIYSITKAGMNALTRSLALEGAPYGVTANTVAPGSIITDSIGDRITPEEIEAAKQAVPVGRGATVEEIAAAVVYLAGAPFVTGETLNINGGAYVAP